MATEFWYDTSPSRPTKVCPGREGVVQVPASVVRCAVLREALRRRAAAAPPPRADCAMGYDVASIRIDSTCHGHDALAEAAACMHDLLLCRGCAVLGAVLLPGRGAYVAAVLLTVVLVSPLSWPSLAVIDVRGAAARVLGQPEVRRCNSGSRSWTRWRVLLSHTTPEELRRVAAVVAKTPWLMAAINFADKDAAWAAGYEDARRALEGVAPDFIWRYVARYIVKGTRGDAYELLLSGFAHMALDEGFRARERRAVEALARAPRTVHASVLRGVWRAAEADVVAVEVAKWRHDTCAHQLLATTTLYDKQQAVHDAVTGAMDDASRETFAMFFVDGRVGTGNTTTLKFILAQRRVAGDVCLVSAPTYCAALPYDGGVTVHSLVELRMQREHVVSQLVPGKPKAQLLRAAKLIIIDQLPLLRRAHLEAVLEILDTLEFKGVLLMSGDFRQIGGVVPFAAAAQQVNASPRMSAAWRYVRMLRLTTSRRDESDPVHAENVTGLGDGTVRKVGTSDIDGRDLVDLSWVRTKIAQRDRAVAFAFPDLDREYDGSGAAACAILAPHNALVDTWNAFVQDKRVGVPRTYIAKSEVEDSEHSAYGILSQDVVEAYTDTSVASHVLKLKEGDIVMLLRTVDKKHALVTNTRCVAQSHRGMPQPTYPATHAGCALSAQASIRCRWSRCAARTRQSCVSSARPAGAQVDGDDPVPYSICRWRTIYRCESAA